MNNSQSIQQESNLEIQLNLSDCSICSIKKINYYILTLSYSLQKTIRFVYLFSQLQFKTGIISPVTSDVLKRGKKWSSETSSTQRPQAGQQRLELRMFRSPVHHTIPLEGKNLDKSKSYIYWSVQQQWWCLIQ